MKTYLLNGRKMASVAGAHRHIGRRMDFPAYYGGNLDALWDILSALGIPARVDLIHAGDLESALGEYAGKLIRVFEEAAAVNPRLRFRVHL